MRGVITSCRGVASVPTSPQKKHSFSFGRFVHSACRSIYGSPSEASLLALGGRAVASALARRLAEHFKRHDVCHWARVLPMPSPSSSLAISMGNGRLPNRRKLSKLSPRETHPAPLSVRFDLAGQFRGLFEGS